MQQYSTFILIALMVVAFYFLIMRPQKKRQQAMQKTINESVPGTRVMLGSGVFGTVVAVGDRQVVLEVSPGVEMTVLKQAISRVVSDGDEDTEFSADEDDELRRRGDHRAGRSGRGRAAGQRHRPEADDRRLIAGPLGPSRTWPRRPPGIPDAP